MSVVFSNFVDFTNSLAESNWFWYNIGLKWRVIVLGGDMKKAVFGCILLLLGGLCSADTLHVPIEYATIHSAVDECNDEDEVVL